MCFKVFQVAKLKAIVIGFKANVENISKCCPGRGKKEEQPELHRESGLQGRACRLQRLCQSRLHATPHPPFICLFKNTLRIL